MNVTDDKQTDRQTMLQRSV